MCVVVGKYFDNIGWVGVKNRDRNYIPDITFKKEFNKTTEVLYFWDETTGYCEGTNSHGISILSASLLVRNDEKEGKSETKHPSLDGAKIAEALLESSLKHAVAKLIKNTLSGHTIIFDSENMYLLEGNYRKGEYSKKGFDYSIKLIPHDQVVARTNHGIEIKHAGYQRNPDSEKQTLSRISSESRLLLSDYVAQTAQTPQQLIDNLTLDFVENDQLNPLRKPVDDLLMRTTSQIMLIPSQQTMYVRPIQCNVKMDYWSLNLPDEQTHVELLSNKLLSDRTTTKG